MNSRRFAFSLGLILSAGGCLLLAPRDTCGNGRVDAGEFCFAPTEVTLDDGIGPRSIAAGDLDLDGDIDLAVANGTSNSVSVLLNEGEGLFLAEDLSLAVGTNPQSVVIVDIDGDGRADIATSDEGNETVTVLFNEEDANGALDFAAVVTLDTDPTDNDADPLNDLPEPERSYTVSVGDLDQDGLADLVVANSIADNVGVFAQTAPRVFGAIRTFGVGDVPAEVDKPRAVALVDVNEDTYLDIATANQNSNNVSILLNDQTGSFLFNTAIAVGQGPFAIAAADIDDDADLDLVTSNFASNDASVLIDSGRGNEEFSLSADPLVVGAAPKYVAPGDFDGDGFADLIVVNSDSNDLTALLAFRDKAGDFVALFSATPFRVGASPQWSATADFNGDGVDDIVSTNQNDNSLTVLLSTR
jgi:hypothetical protein